MLKLYYFALENIMFHYECLNLILEMSKHNNEESVLTKRQFCKSPQKFCRLVLSQLDYKHQINHGSLNQG